MKAVSSQFEDAYTGRARQLSTVAPVGNTIIRVTHLSTYASHGGAARAALRLHRNLLAAGCRSTMLVRHAGADEPGVERIEPDRRLSARLRRRGRRIAMRAALARIRRRIVDEVEYFAYDRTDLGTELLERLPPSDVVNLHWVVGLLDHERQLPALAGRAPLVWRLSDMSPLTGGCVYAWDCTRFRSRCGACPQLGSSRAQDAATAIFDRKLGAYDRIDPARLRFVALTSWMAGLVRQSRLGERFGVSVIPNSIDHLRFSPRERAAARAALDLPADAPAILFIAHDPTVPRKGLKALLGAIARLPRANRPLLVTIGARAPEISVTAHRHLGLVDDDATLVEAYSAVDLVAVPSLQENLPNTALEAIACGTPVVGFDVGGIPDIVRSGETGLLAPAGDEAELSAAIDALLGDAGLRARLARNCREVAVREYDPRLQAERYLELYRSMIE